MNSPIATLETRATTESATAPRAEHVAGVARCTGQYVYDLLIGGTDATKADVTKMDFVRWCVANIDTDSFKKAMKDFVEIAAKRSDAYKKTAQNHQSVLRTAYGALKFAHAQLNMLGADNSTGYQAMRVIGKKALDSAGIKWDGSKVVKTDKDIAMMDEAQAMRLAEIRRDNPPKADETAVAHEQRCRALLATEMAEEHGLENLVQRKKHADLADKVAKLCEDDETLASVLGQLLTRLQDKGFDVSIG